MGSIILIGYFFRLKQNYFYPTIVPRLRQQMPAIRQKTYCIGTGEIYIKGTIGLVIK